MESMNTELYDKLTQLQGLLYRHQLIQLKERGPFADVSRGQGRVIAMLKMQPQISTKNLSYLLGIRQQSLNELINKLEKAGFVTRTPSETDKRVMMVQLTEKGESAQLEEPTCPDIFGSLNEQEQAALSDYLSRLIQALEQQVDSEKDEWSKAMRERMGDEAYEHMVAARRACMFGRHDPRPPFPHGHRGHGPGRPEDGFDERPEPEV